MAISNRSKKFFRDFGIYGIGVLGTRIITFLMIPLYTYFIQKSDYGYFDLCLNLCLLMIPVMTLQMREGAFRFLLVTQDDNERQSIITAIYKQFTVNLVIGSAVFAILYCFIDANYMLETGILLAVMSFHEIILQITRGLGKNKVYATSNILNAFFIGLLSVLFVVILKTGVEGIYLANIISRLLAIVYIEIRTKTRIFINLSINTSSSLKRLLSYTLPLIPVSLCYWITTSCDRFFVKHYIGLEMNGLYAVAVRLTLIIQTLSIVFYQSWQETALLQYHSKDRDVFFSKVFECFVYALTILLVAYTFVLKMSYSWLIDQHYSQSLMFIYPLGVSALLSAMSSSFFDLGYQCAKDTARSMIAVILTAILNFCLNFTLVPHLGVWGAITTSICCFLFMNLYRYFDTRRYFSISLRKTLLIPAALIILSGIVFYSSHSLLFDMAYCLTCCMLLLACSPIDVNSIISRILHNKKTA